MGGIFGKEVCGNRMKVLKDMDGRIEFQNEQENLFQSNG